MGWSDIFATAKHTLAGLLGIVDPPDEYRDIDIKPVGIVSQAIDSEGVFTPGTGNPDDYDADGVYEGRAWSDPLGTFLKYQKYLPYAGVAVLYLIVRQR